MHMVSKKDLNSAELETMKISKNPTTVMTANGEVQTKEEATVYVKQVDLFVTVMLLEETPRSSFTRETLWGIMGIPTTGLAVKNHISSEVARELIAISRTFVPFVVHGLLTSSSTSSSPASSTSSSQDSVIGTENPATERSETVSEESGRNPSHEHRETSSSPHELPMEPRAKVELGSGKHSIYTHFPIDPNCDICLKTKITKASCRRRADTVVPRAENYGD